MSPLRSVLIAASVSCFAPAASAIELYATPPGNVVVVRSPVVYAPPPVVYVPPQPRVVYVRNPLVVTQPVVSSTVTVTVPSTPTPAEPEDPPTHPQTPERRDAPASVFVGGGYGGMTAFHGAASTWRLHVGLGLGATEIGIRGNIANRALGDVGNTAGGVWGVSAEVAHRFLPGATVRPVIGASFDRWQFEPDGASSSSAFGIGARAGVEVHYHLNPGAALVFGADLGYHRLLTSVDDVSVAPNMMTFGATVDIRL